MSKRLRVIDAIEGYYLALTLECLHREGVLAALAAGRGVPDIARDCDFHLETLTTVLEFVASRSDLVNRLGSDGAVEFEVAPAYRASAMPAHLIDQYVGAYGPCLTNLGTVLRNPLQARFLVDHGRHAKAYASGGELPGQLVRLIEDLRVGLLLDIGCGTAELLAELGRRTSSFRGIGVDSNALMVAESRRRLAAEGLTGRIAIRLGDALSASAYPGKSRCARVDLIVAVSMVNAYFGPSSRRSIDRLFGTLRALFPNRFMIICDYYGHLGYAHDGATGLTRTLVHDMAQVASGQGVPPANLRAWRKVYARVGCTLVTSFEASNDGIAWFIHLIQL